MPSATSLLLQARDHLATEVLVMAGDCPSMRVDGKWVRLTNARCKPADVEKVVMTLLPPERLADLEASREVEFEHRAGDAGMVLCNVHYQRGTLVALIKLLDPPRSFVGEFSEN